MLILDSDPATTAPEASRWTADHIVRLGTDVPCGTVIDAAQAAPILPELVLWDLWPLQLDDGAVARVAGGELWMILSAPRTDDPDDRHDLARIRLFHRVGDAWRDCGALLPDGFAPGSREWSGSARLDPESGIVTLWFTAAGHRGQSERSFEQRLFHCTGSLVLDGPAPRIRNWSPLMLSVRNDGTHYADLAVDQGIPGRIKGFRDPYWFRDPADGQGYILFTASKARHASQSDYDGVVGIAAASDADGLGEFRLLPPLVDGDGLVNEMERPHVIMRDGLYYLFWSSQKQVFSPDGVQGPTGLYGMVSHSLFGAWEPINGSGLVLANPPSEPRQAYAWQVLPTLEVAGFVDYWGLEGRATDTDPALKAAQFGGTVAPMVTITLTGATSQVVRTAG